MRRAGGIPWGPLEIHWPHRPIAEYVHMKCYPTPCLEFLEGRNLLGTLGGTRLPAADVQSTLHFVPMKGTAVGVATLGERVPFALQR